MRGEKDFGGMYDGGEANIPNVGTAEAGGEAMNEAGTESVAEASETFVVPTEYVEKGWAKDLKSYDDVYKKLDGAETLIGARPSGVDLPKEDATPEDLASFYGAIGRPEEAGAYKFNREGQSEAMSAFNSDEMDSAVKEIFHKYGLRPEQATGLQTDYEALINTAFGEQIEAKQKLDDDFEKVTTEKFGNEKETILENAKVLLKQHTPSGFEEYVKDLPNESLIVMAGVLNDIKSKYISEDAFNNLGGGNNKGGSKDELRKQAQEMMQTKEFTDAFNPRYEETQAEVTELYAKIASMS